MVLFQMHRYYSVEWNDIFGTIWKSWLIIKMRSEVITAMTMKITLSHSAWQIISFFRLLQNTGNGLPDHRASRT